MTEHVQLALAGFEPQTSVARVKHSTNVANRDIPLGKTSRSYFNTTGDIYMMQTTFTQSLYDNLRSHVSVHFS